MTRLMALGILTFVAGAAAQTSAPRIYFGINTLGAQATYDAGPYALRLSGGGRTVLGLIYGVGADAAALYSLNSDPAATSRLSLGAGLDVNYYFASPLACTSGVCLPGSAVIYRPHVLLNYERNMNARASFFVETSLGYAIVPGVASGVYPGLRLGLNFR